jgi:beta-1,4-mannosyl-glycoprotein beta-1,4-N-acetylglucosaminyltransferase
MNILADYVDYFVITESYRTFTGAQKAYNLADNFDRFKDFHDKIIYIQLNDDDKVKEGNVNPWHLEANQRNQLIQGLKDAKTSDTIIISDLDEIPNPEIIRDFDPSKSFGVCVHRHFIYFLNNIQVLPKRKQESALKQFWYQIKGFTPYPNTVEPFWLGSCLFKKDLLKKYSLQEIRDISRAKRIKGSYLMNGGWHFTFMGDVQFIKQKLMAFSHQEFNTSEINNEANITQKVTQGLSLFDDAKFELLPLSSNRLPAYVRDNADKFPKLIGKPKG